MPTNPAYFRNRTEIEDCEPDSLWILAGDKIILVDDDQYIFVIMDDCPDVFYEVPDPFK